MIDITVLPVQSNNYSYLLLFPEAMIIVDPTVAYPILEKIKTYSKKHYTILNTHHHYDHTAGNAEVKRQCGGRIVAPMGVSPVDRCVKMGDTIACDGCVIDVISTPGHTRTSVVYYVRPHDVFPGAVFTGDTLFVGGCGRLFEGTAKDLWESFKRIRTLPDETLIYCGHEYTEDNYAFAATLTPDDEAVASRLRDVTAICRRKQLTVPSTIGLEKQTNPFMRVDDPLFAEAVGCAGMAPEEVFARIRKRKDSF